MNWSDLQPFATAIAGFAAFAGFGLTLVKERHPLNAVERLTATATAIQTPATRRLVEDYRDEQAAHWVLTQRAPAERGLRWLGVGLRIVSAVAFLLWVVGVTLDPAALASWVAYVAGVLLFVAGSFSLLWRTHRRDAWMRQERLWRGVAEPETARRVRPLPRDGAASAS